MRFSQWWFVALCSRCLLRHTASARLRCIVYIRKVGVDAQCGCQSSEALPNLLLSAAAVVWLHYHKEREMTKEKAIIAPLAVTSQLRDTVSSRVSSSN